VQSSHMENWISWTIVGASLIHICEEYYGGWIRWVQKYATGVTSLHFVAVNFVFVCLCIAASTSNSLLAKLSIASLIFINSCIHIVPTIFFKHYSPGIWSAIVLYLPLSFLSFYSAWNNGNLSIQNTLLAVLIGLLIMAFPITAQFIRIQLMRRKQGVLK
jgi:VIT1/CCC1 family predicted Fe2+/Mn2+ transporter